MRAGTLTRAATATAVALTVALVATASADTRSSLRRDLGTLRDAESRAILDLFAVDAALARADRRVAALEASVQTSRQRIDEARRALVIGQRNLRIARAELTVRVTAAYRSGGLDPIQVLLSADSVADAIDRLSIVNRVTANDAQVVGDVARGVRVQQDAARSLAKARATLATALEEARSQSLALRAARTEKATLLADLRRREHLTAGRIAQLGAAAAAAQQKAATITSPPPSGGATAGGGTPPPPPPATSTAGSTGGTGGTGGGTPGGPVSSGQTLVVRTTAYAIHGTTATGIPTRRGVCATDPRLIPMGTRFTVSGYGECVAADTGGDIKGAWVDVWVATEAEASAWGMRQSTITIR